MPPTRTTPNPPPPAGRGETRASAPGAGRKPAPPPRWVWMAAWPVTAVFVLSNAPTPLYVRWQQEIGFSKGTLTVIFACYILGLLVSLLVSGVVSDRLGRKPVLLPALGLALAACLLFATAHSVPALLLARLFTGLAVGAAVSAGMAAVTDVAAAVDAAEGTQGARSRLGALLASCAMVLGAGLGPLLSGVLAEILSAPIVPVFTVEAAALALAVLAVLRMPLARPTGPVRGAWLRPPRVPRRNRTELALGIAVFGPGITATSFVLSLGPSLLSGLLHSDNKALAGGMAFVMFLIATAAQFAVRRLRTHAVLLAGAASTLAGTAALIWAVHASSITALVLAAALAGAGQGMGQLGGLSLLNSSVPRAHLAEANAALNVGGYLPAGTLPVAAGYLSDATGLTTGATTFAAVLAALALSGGLLVLGHRARAGKRP